MRPAACNPVPKPWMARPASGTTRNCPAEDPAVPSPTARPPNLEIITSSILPLEWRMTAQTGDGTRPRDLTGFTRAQIVADVLEHLQRWRQAA